MDIQNIKVNWKVVMPIALLVGVLLLYFVRVKPIEGMENKDCDFNANIKKKLAEVEAWNKSTGTDI